MARKALEAGQVWFDMHSIVHCAECGPKGLLKPKAKWAGGYMCNCDKCGSYTTPNPQHDPMWTTYVKYS